MNLTEEQVRERLREAIKSAGSQKIFAARYGFTPSYVHDVLHGRRAFADRILEAIGVERIDTYRLKEQTGTDTGTKQAGEA